MKATVFPVFGALVGGEEQLADIATIEASKHMNLV
jgi:hypothetical protein